MSKLIFEKKSQNLGEHLPSPSKNFDLAEAIPKGLLRKNEPALPEVSELDVVRHFTRLAQQNFCVDTNFYPLGSCTMKYNPKVNDQITTWPFYARVHPYQEESEVQGILQIIEELEKDLSQITGMDEFSLQPAAGAQGEFAGLLMVRAYHKLGVNDLADDVLRVLRLNHPDHPALASLEQLQASPPEEDL